MSTPPSDSNISVKVSFRGNSHELSVALDASLSTLQALLEERTGVPAAHQKLLFRGKKIQHDGDEDTTISSVGIRPNITMTLLGPTPDELNSLEAIETAHRKRERILAERAKKPQTKIRNTGSAKADDIRYVFHSIAPLPHLPHPDTARDQLTRLASDPAVKHIMRMHQFSVGLLTELAPHEHPNLLGQNTNRGESIKLRIRTDRYDGFRPYLEVRRVLCHELTHNVWGDHDNNFKELNSRLNREIAEYERSLATGTHVLSEGAQYAYNPATNEEAEVLAHVLGGPSNTTLSDAPEDRRHRVLEAATARLRKEEEALEESCGTAGPQADADVRREN